MLSARTRSACVRQSGGREACAPDMPGACQHSSGGRAQHSSNSTPDMPSAYQQCMSVVEGSAVRFKSSLVQIGIIQMGLGNQGYPPHLVIELVSLAYFCIL